MVKFKSQRNETEVKGNVQKYLSYKEAWARIEQAQNDGYYLEAVTIIESIISDRLLSFLVGIGKIDRESKKVEKIGFGNLIDQWRSVVGQNGAASPQAIDEILSLVDRVNSWRDKRNLVVHGIVKSLPGTATEDVTSFLW